MVKLNRRLVSVAAFNYANSLGDTLGRTAAELHKTAAGGLPASTASTLVGHSSALKDRDYNLRSGEVGLSGVAAGRQTPDGSLPAAK